MIGDFDIADTATVSTRNTTLEPTDYLSAIASGQGPDFDMSLMMRFSRTDVSYEAQSIGEEYNNRRQTYMSWQVRLVGLATKAEDT